MLTRLDIEECWRDFAKVQGEQSTVTSQAPWQRGKVSSHLDNSGGRKEEEGWWLWRCQINRSRR